MSDALPPTPPVSAPAPYAPVPSSPDRNPAALVALLLGIAAMALGLISQLALVGLVRSGAYDVYPVVSAIISAGVLLLAAAAVVVGLVAVQRPAGRLRAGIGVGIGIAEVVGVLGSFALNGILSLL